MTQDGAYGGRDLMLRQRVLESLLSLTFGAGRSLVTKVILDSYVSSTTIYCAIVLVRKSRTAESVIDEDGTCFDS